MNTLMCLYKRSAKQCGLDEAGPEAIPVALARASSAGAACPLAGRSLGDGRHHQAVHPNLAVVYFLLGKTWVHHIVDAVNSQ